MARLTDDQKSALIDQIREHLLIEGPRNWEGLEAKWPEVSRSTLWRLIRETRERMEGQAAMSGSPGELREVQKRIRERVEPAEHIQERIKAHLPTAPSPAVVAASPRDVMKAFNFFAFFDRIVKDAELARGSNLRENPDGTVKVINPAMFDRNISRRLGILQTYLQSVEVIYNVERIRELYELIMDAVGEADPEVQQAVLAKLRALNNKRGLTMAARP
ncbi:hypothetical protein [Bordetella phage vB_BbrM_PHB04]|uniref:Uncharacterized protein n=1 Tax=Bordetella phage vB_BbrM_PHB04 TaxID=2029657 RepID=A0A291LA47_9CAUD|nr:hypothetical protein HOS14_gp056 [Bordetella phage vB_BbrM_PHB04]ATI15674.1 hypothetical protein [Bordetella phage vB_BbrM_PHB04]